MKKLLAILVLCISFTGCVNVCTRNPWSRTRIEDTYQCTQEAAGISWIIMFPQTMGYGNSNGFMLENIFTVPLGLVGFCDTACEAVLDTICLPYDWPVSNHRNKYKRDGGDDL